MQIEIGLRGCYYLNSTLELANVTCKALTIFFNKYTIEDSVGLSVNKMEMYSNRLILKLDIVQFGYDVNIVQLVNNFKNHIRLAAFDASIYTTGCEGFTEKDLEDYRCQYNVNFAFFNLFNVLYELNAAFFKVDELTLTNAMFPKLTKKPIPKMQCRIENERVETLLMHERIKLKKADFIGDSLWQFVLKKIIYAYIKDEDFLEKVRTSKISLHAGMEMICKLRADIVFNKHCDKNIPKYIRYSVLKVQEVLPCRSGGEAEQLMLAACV